MQGLKTVRGDLFYRLATGLFLAQNRAAANRATLYFIWRCIIVSGTVRGDFFHNV